LRFVFDQHLKVEIGDGGSVQDAPELLFLRADFNFGGEIVGVGHRDEIDGEIFRGLAAAGAGVEDVALGVAHDEQRGHRICLHRPRVWIQQVLVADYEDSFGEAGDFRVGSFDAFYY